MQQSGAPKQSVDNNNNSNSSSAHTISYAAERIIGNGSFGVVFQATVVQTGEVVAIKKVLQDKRFKNRELQIMRKLNHPNIVHLKHCFYSNGDNAEELYLNLVLEFVPETVCRVSRFYTRANQRLPIILVKLYAYQLCRALGYIHALGICHRDVKPQNLLVNPETHILKLCDFGSAKALVVGEPNVSYICSRYYRAPELIFGATNYTTMIDIWSLGCVIGELLIGRPLFPGENGVEQLVEIVKILGTPTKDEIYAMNENYKEFKFPQVVRTPWQKVFPSSTPAPVVELAANMLIYRPTDRIHPLHALSGDVFAELKDRNTRLPDGKPIRMDLFNFTEAELGVHPQLTQELLALSASALQLTSIGNGHQLNDVAMSGE